MTEQQRGDCPQSRGLVSAAQDVMIVCVSLVVVSIVALVALAVN